MRYTAVNSSVSEYGTPWWSVRDPGMPVRTSPARSFGRCRRARRPQQPVPVHSHRAPGRRVGDDRRRPLDRMDLRHQRRVDQPRSVVELIVRPGRVGPAKVVADGVVLEREEDVQEPQAEPEVPGHVGEIEVRVELARRQSVLADRELPPFVRPNRGGETPGVAVDLRAVPPVAVARRPRRRARAVARGVRKRPRDAQRALGPGVAVGNLELPRRLPVALGVAEPVMHLELDPGGGEDVQRRRRVEGLARQQLRAHDPRVRRQEGLLRLRIGVRQRNVAAEPAADAPHGRVGEIVEGPVDRPVQRPAVARRRHDIPDRCGRVGVVEIFPTQLVAEAREDHEAQRPGQLVPAEPPIDGAGYPSEQRRVATVHHGSPTAMKPAQLQGSE